MQQFRSVSVNRQNFPLCAALIVEENALVHRTEFWSGNKRLRFNWWIRTTTIALQRSPTNEVSAIYATDQTCKQKAYALIMKPQAGGTDIGGILIEYKSK
ncbi:MAG TPA: hypothetical protein VGJ33_07965 [Candidatus Angelobacter sp.]